MIVNFKLEPEDFYDFDLKNLDNFPEAKRILYFQRFIVPVIYIIIGYLIYKFNFFSKNQAIILTSIIVIGWIIYYPRFVKKNMKKRTLKTLQDNPLLLRYRKMLLNDKGLHEIIESEEGEKTLLLSEKIIGYNESDDKLYINLPNGSAYILPLNAIKNKEELFLKLDELKS